MSQLKKYDYIIENRIKNAKNWIKKLKNKDIEFKSDVDGSTYSHCVALVESRDEWLEKYRKKKTQLGILIEYSIPYMSAYKEYKKGEYPVSLEYSQKTINFPNWV